MGDQELGEARGGHLGYPRGDGEQGEYKHDDGGDDHGEQEQRARQGRQVAERELLPAAFGTQLHGQLTRQLTHSPLPPADVEALFARFFAEHG